MCVLCPHACLTRSDTKIQFYEVENDDNSDKKDVIDIIMVNIVPTGNSSKRNVSDK